MSFYIYLLSALFGVGSLFLLLYKQKTVDQKLKKIILSEKILFLILLILTLNSILFFLHINNLFLKSWITLTITIFLDLIVFVFFYFYILVKINIINKIKKSHFIHLILPLLLLFFLSQILSGLQSDISFINNFDKVKRNKNGPQMLQMKNMVRQRFYNRFAGYPQKQTHIRNLVLDNIGLIFFAYSGNNFGLSNLHSNNLFKKKSSTGKANFFMFSLLFKWIYLLLMLVNIFYRFKKSNRNSITKLTKEFIWLTVLLTTISMSLLMWTNIFFFRLPANDHLAFFRIFKSFPVGIFYTFLIGIYLISFRKVSYERKYGKNLITISELNKHYNTLITYMKKEKPYYNESLTLKQLADDLKINANDLSQIINKKQSCNFRDFINSFRIEEVKQQLLDNSEKNILSIALDAGFNSKSGFNLVFKKHTNITPSEFIKNNKNRNRKKTEGNFFTKRGDLLSIANQNN